MRIRGVYYSERLGKWQAKITRDGRIHQLGYFATEAEAQRKVLEFDLEYQRKKFRDFERKEQRRARAAA